MSNSPPIIELPSEIGVLQNQPEHRNNVLKTHFRFVLKRTPTTVYFCQSANIPGMNISVAEQNTVFNPVIRPAGAITHDNLTLRFLIDEGFKNWIELRNWMLQCSDYENFDEYAEPREHFSDTAALFILNSNHLPTLKYTFQNLFPVRLGGISLDSTTPTSEPIYTDVSFAFTSMGIQRA